MPSEDGISGEISSHCASVNTRVRDMGPTITDDHAQLMETRPNSIGLLRDLGDAAAAAAGSAARLAALRALPEDVERLTRFAHEFSVATQSNVCRRADSRFHIEIGVAAQSPRLTLSILQLQGESSPLLWAPGTLLTDQSAQEHALIVEAIKNRDEQRAQMLSVEHCEREAKVLIEHHLRLATAEQRGGYRV